MKNYAIIVFLLFFIFVAPAWAQDSFFRAEVLEVLEQNEQGQQRLLLNGLEGEYLGEEFEFNGIGDIEVLNSQVYRAGDKVMVVASYGPEGQVNFYISDYVRTGALAWLAVLFVLALLLIGRWKGLRSLLSLALTFVVIVKFMIPQILAGANPLVITLIGSLIILLIIIYVTEGVKQRAHISVVSIFISLGLTVLLSQIFVTLTRLTGAASEDVLFLFNIEGAQIDLAGLLLAGIIIGTLGVLDDVVIAQVSTVEQLKKSNPALGVRDLFRKAYDVGVSHIASMTNTLFLAYAGVSLPLLILFATGQSAIADWQQAINTELIATEIVRTLSGSIGLILAVPISTWLAAWWVNRIKN